MSCHLMCAFDTLYGWESRYKCTITFLESQIFKLVGNLLSCHFRKLKEFFWKWNGQQNVAKLFIVHVYFSLCGGDKITRLWFHWPHFDCMTKLLWVSSLKSWQTCYRWWNNKPLWFSEVLVTMDKFGNNLKNIWANRWLYFYQTWHIFCQR